MAIEEHKNAIVTLVATMTQLAPDHGADDPIKEKAWQEFGPGMLIAIGILLSEDGEETNTQVLYERALRFLDEDGD